MDHLLSQFHIREQEWRIKIKITRGVYLYRSHLQPIVQRGSTFERLALKQRTTGIDTTMKGLLIR